MKRPGLLASIAALCLSAAAAPRPNIVILLADDLGYGEPGCYGGTDIPTPHIDSLARGGVRFTSGYVTAPFCAASRAALLTGRTQTRFGFEFNPLGARNEDPAVGLPKSERTIADRLRETGYATACIGKWHLGGTAEFHPQRRGFDEFFGFLHEGHTYVPIPWERHVTWLRRKTLPGGGEGRWTAPGGRVIWSTHMGRNEDDYDADNPVLRSGQPVDERENLTDAFAREAESFIDRHRSQPFLLYLAFSAVHSPMQGDDRHLRRFRGIDDMHRRIFAAMTAHLDDAVGRVLDKLRACGIEDNTLVFFIGDNGGPTRELTSSNRPWRGEKGQLLEGGIRVPYILRWPGRVPAGREEARMVSSLDLVPTALAAAGVPVPPRLDGLDLTPRMSSPDGGPIHSNLYWRVGGQAAFRADDWKICRTRGGAWQLYNLASDPGEAENLAAADPAKLAELDAAWRAMDTQMVEPLWK